MAVAKIARSNFGKLKKKVKKVAGRFFAPPMFQDKWITQQFQSYSKNKKDEGNF
jgi:hypothetical protein